MMQNLFSIAWKNSHNLLYAPKNLDTPRSVKRDEGFRLLNRISQEFHTKIPTDKINKNGHRDSSECYPLVNIQKNYGKSPFLMGKSTINHHFQWLCLFTRGYDRKINMFSECIKKSRPREPRIGSFRITILHVGGSSGVRPDSSGQRLFWKRWASQHLMVSHRFIDRKMAWSGQFHAKFGSHFWRYKSRRGHAPGEAASWASAAAKQSALAPLWPRDFQPLGFWMVSGLGRGCLLMERDRVSGLTFQMNSKSLQV
jgi:hypothetical protein